MADRLASPHAAYRERSVSGDLVVQRCNGCSGQVFPPRVLCPSCGGTDLGWETVEGHGIVYSASVVSAHDEDPYCVALVDLESGVRVMGNVVGTDPYAVRLGAYVQGKAISAHEHVRLEFEVVAP